jgi:hypothetical protein
MESLFTFIGLKWAGYFLSFWIIFNVSGAFTSFELMPASTNTATASRSTTPSKAHAPSSSARKAI